MFLSLLAFLIHGQRNTGKKDTGQNYQKKEIHDLVTANYSTINTGHHVTLRLMSLNLTT